MISLRTTTLAMLLLASMAAAATPQQESVPARITALAAQLEVHQGYAKPPALRTLWQLVHQCSRPGAGAERAECAQGLLEILRQRPQLPAATRAEVLRMVAIAANDPRSIASAAVFLDDPDLGEAALFALERCSHPAAEKILVQRLSQPGAVPLSAIIAALGSRRSQRAVEPLLALAAGSDRQVAHAARAALARIGDERAEACLRAALERGAPDAGDHLLRLVEHRLRAAQRLRDQAARSYSELLDASTPSVRLAALAGLDALGVPLDHEHLLALLGDPAPRVRGAVQRRLVHSSDPALAPFLLRSIEGAPPRVHAGILRVLTARGEGSAKLLVLLAASERDAVLYPTALELLGTFDDPAVEPVLRAAVRGGAPEARDAAARSLLAQARRELGREHRAKALDLLHLGLDATDDDGPAGELIGELATLASPSSLYHLDRWAARPEQRENVARARLAIARALGAKDRNRAIELLYGVCSLSSSRATRREACGVLKELGADVSRIALRSGFLTAWKIMTPFPESTEKDFGTHPFGPSGPTFAERIESAGRELSWRSFHSEDPDGIVDLKAFQPSEHVRAYAGCILEWPEDATVTVKAGSDDGIAVWVNGERVHANRVFRGLSLDADTFQAHLRKGPNRILLEIDQGGGDWGFALRLTDRDGVPIDLSKGPARPRKL